MKKEWIEGTIALTVLLALLVTVGLATGQQFSVATPPGTLATCPAPTSTSNILCSVTDGYYASIAGAAYVKINASAGPVITGAVPIVVSPTGVVSCPTCSTTSNAVTSLNGRTGAITLTKADVVNTGISVTATTTANLQ